jgi:hypothetical protein
MRVTFRTWIDALASSRYRASIPARELAKLGIGEGRDWLVIGKHGWKFEDEAKGFERVCFDVCDDHFYDQYAEHYRKCCGMADLLTCNSAEMARVIKAETGRSAVVIPDPYEQPEREPRIHSRLLWFGHEVNLPDLVPWLDDIGDIEVVSGAQVPGITQWSPEAMDAAFDRAGLVVLPTGRRLAKSGNRAIEAIRRGLFVVAGYLPAYADLGIYVGNITDGIEWALSHPREAKDRILASQEYVRAEYSPRHIAMMWRDALS